LNELNDRIIDKKKHINYKLKEDPFYSLLVKYKVKECQNMLKSRAKFIEKDKLEKDAAYLKQRLNGEEAEPPSSDSAAGIVRQAIDALEASQFQQAKMFLLNALKQDDSYFKAVALLLLGCVYRLTKDQQAIKMLSTAYKYAKVNEDHLVCFLCLKWLGDKGEWYEYHKVQLEAVGVRVEEERTN
jgi:hypothetical protein